MDQKLATKEKPNAKLAGEDRCETAKTIRGSGYTYDEAEHPSDGVEPAKDDTQETIVKLPKLGKHHF
jgi:hypothetical protein